MSFKIIMIIFSFLNLIHSLDNLRLYSNFISKTNDSRKIRDFSFLKIDSIGHKKNMCRYYDKKKKIKLK